MFLINFWLLFQVQSYLPLGIVNYGVSKHYAGSMVSDRCPLGYLFIKIRPIIHSNLIIHYALIFSSIDKKIGLFIIFRPSFFTIPYLIGPLFTFPYKKALIH